MPLIRCPACGHSVLSVASSCPNCSHLLAQNPMQAGEASALRECPRCGKFIDRAAPVCVYCDYPVRRRGFMRSATVAVIGAAVVTAVAVVAVRQRASDGSAVTPPPTVAAAPIQAAPPAAHRPAEAPATTPPDSNPVSRPPAAPRAVPSGRPMRWAATWVNVRERRGTTSPIVLVLTPGTRVEVADSFSGWWAVYANDARVGYASAALLATDSTVRLSPDSLD
ncbi:MAG TPA: SH3 domain-containing protein [Gemmatimonadales bacterium]